jgi:hypothetical protein
MVYCWPVLLLNLVFNGIKCSRLKKRPKRHLFSVTAAKARRATDATPTLGSRSPGAGCIGELVAIWSMAAFAWSRPAAVALSWKSLSAPQAAAEGAVLHCSHTALDRRRSSPRAGARRLPRPEAAEGAFLRCPPHRAGPRSFGAVGRSSLLPSTSSFVTMMTRTRSCSFSARTMFC